MLTLVDGPVFISYAREDFLSARRLAEELKSRDVDVWLDVDQLVVGQDWAAEIESAIAKSQLFIALLSTNSVHERGYVQAELKLALNALLSVPDNQAFILPVRLDECQVPGRLEHLHYEDLFRANGMTRLVGAVCRLLGRPDDGPVHSASAGAVRFAVMSIASDNAHWGEIPRGQHAREGRDSRGKVGLYGLRSAQYFHITSFKTDVDPSFDVTIMNCSRTEPAILHRVGVMWTAVAQMMHPYGIPTAGAILRTASYVIDCPDIRQMYGAQIEQDEFAGFGPVDCEIEASTGLADPIYFEPHAPFRFKIELRDYFRRVPNHSLLRLWVETDRGHDYSNELELFTL